MLQTRVDLVLPDAKFCVWKSSSFEAAPIWGISGARKD